MAERGEGQTQSLAGLDPALFEANTQARADMLEAAASVIEVTRSAVAQATAIARALKFPKFEWSLEAGMALDYLGKLQGKSDDGSRLLAEWVGQLSLQEATQVIPLLKPVSGPRGRPKGTGKREDEIRNAALSLWQSLGRSATDDEIAAWIEQTTAPNSQKDSIKRDIRRRRGRTKISG